MKYFILYIMDNNYFTIGIILLIIFFICLSFFYSNYYTKEGWANYERKPLDILTTGSTPLNYYRKDLYRLPYRYPFTFQKSYPLPNQSYYELL